MSISDLFIGTAAYYARYRVPYPDALFSMLRSEAHLSGCGRLLDLGCGTGEIAVTMSPDVREVWAVDVDAEMLREARARADRSGATNIKWIGCRAEDFEAPDAAWELVTIGAAYHWMDREGIAERCRRWLVEGQPVAVLGSNSVWTGSAEWQQVARDVIRKWLGDERRAGSGTFDRPTRRHEVVLTEAGFDVNESAFHVRHTWTLDTFMGYLFSTSFASLEVLGGAAKNFETEMRRTLLDYNGSGQYEERIEFYCILARPRG